MCGRGDIGKIRRCPILTWLFKNLHTYFQWEDPSPFQQSLWQHPRHPYVATPTLQKAQTDSPSLLNRFLRFQRRCNLLIQTFPTMYDMTRFSEISTEYQVNNTIQ